MRHFGKRGQGLLELTGGLVEPGLGTSLVFLATGGTGDEIDLRIASLEDAPDQADDPADALPEFSTQPAVIHAF